MVQIERIRIIGAGLIGTSIGLALKQQGFHIDFQDIDSAAEALAADLVGAVDLKEVDLYILATPISATFGALKTAYTENPAAWFIDISGVKSEVMQQVEQFPEMSRRFCATHPMAGREFTGPSAAQADLFVGRAWIVLPTLHSDLELVDWVENFVRDVGSTPYLMNAAKHDEVIAAISQLPQVISSNLGTLLNDFDLLALSLAGGGLRDVTRLAGSSGEIWSDLLISNRTHLIPLLERFQSNLSALIESLNRQNSKELKSFFVQANLGRARISGKHGAQMRDYTYLPVVIDDRPGQLAALFDACSEVSVNVEDLTIEHSPGQETGLITLALSSEDAQKLHVHLLNEGWGAHQPRK